MYSDLRWRQIFAKNTDQWNSTGYFAGIRVAIYFRIFLSIHLILSEYVTVFEIYFLQQLSKAEQNCYSHIKSHGMKHICNSWHFVKTKIYSLALN